ncbi:MAG: IgGFc-binding protein, partial [Flavobacteriales bacterium]
MLPTRGTEFHLGFMQNAYGAQELRIYISSPTANSGTVEMPLIGWSQSFTVPANGTTLVVVPNSAEHLGSEVVSNQSVRVTCADPATVSAVSFQSFTNDGAQVLPTQALGTEYVVDAYRGLPGFNEFYKSELLIVATADNTQIQVTPSVNTAGGRPAGVPFTITLNAGETYQVQSALSSLDLSGTTVLGTAASGPCRPFAVFGGSMCANVPVGCPACDHLYEQMIPVEHWGTNFHTFRMAGFNTYTTRVLARQNGTSVILNGGTPIVLNAGQRHEFNGLTAPACINASAPISAVQVFEGYNCSGAGDPAMVVLEPDPRTTRQAIFSTV